jgi:predicted nucleic acid-binding protein
LTPAAATAFQLAEIGRATIIVPAIVIAELYYLSVKLRDPFPPMQLLNFLDTAFGIEVTDLGRSQLAQLDRFPEIPEMHDRLIAAEAAVLNAPVITRDPVLIASPQIETIW